MATYEIIEQEGLRRVKVTLASETVKTEAGAMYYMRGNIEMTSKAPSAGGFLKAMVTGESVFRPTYTGSGELHLEPSFGGFHVLDVQDEAWILEHGAYWASDAGIEVDVHRDSTLTSLKSGEGFMNFQTKIKGRGQVVLNAPGPVELMHLKNERLTVDGKYVLARPASMKYTVQRATKSLLGSLTSGEGMVSIFEGTGTILIAPMPFWRERLFNTLRSALSVASAARK